MLFLNKEEIAFSAINDSNINNFQSLFFSFWTQNPSYNNFLLLTAT